MRVVLETSLTERHSDGSLIGYGFRSSSGVRRIGQSFSVLSKGVHGNMDVGLDLEFACCSASKCLP